MYIFLNYDDSKQNGRNLDYFSEQSSMITAVSKRYSFYHNFKILIPK